ncbi:hypothetical protein [Scopulibacillus cellulosilyticus]|uniref:Uncharacterized protein n=1 Tax=Scopulibacillus cellulosilyticus TaxID=2665665 RepID=A0ABW2PW22_9BACL
MILVQCIKDVYKQSEHHFIEYINQTCLFKKGYFYMVTEDEKGQWLAKDEEDMPHVISDGRAFLHEDFWFHEHFILA